jgi:ASC-1-like (ASCH) protein/ribosomal protein S18 acetylase RimI-like enzyme
MSNIIIRPALPHDFDFVVSLMQAALSPYYDGDHRSHAKRIFDAHLGGGLDRLGFFSVEQSMSIAEADGTPMGVIHLVWKRQGTLKISPLIVSERHRGGQGVGKALLQHAESYARKRSARTIYCTVAEQNRSALSFFLRNGYIRAGSSPSHYKVGVTESMLHKFINDELVDDFDRSHISVLPMEIDQQPAVKQMLLNRLPPHFMGIDESWIDNLFSGYERRNSRDVNLKYKLIYTALDRSNLIRGIAGATPKKGEPIKLMPLVSNDDAAFFALLSDVPQRLAEFGRKVYVHIVPTSRQTRFLQKAGWILDGLLPEAYQLETVTQQWSYDTKTDDARVQTIRLKQRYLEFMRRGKKTLEVRVAYDQIKKLSSGEVVSFVSRDDKVVATITAIRKYRSFSEMLANEDHRRIVPDMERQQVERLLREIYPAPKERLGVVVLEVVPDTSRP